MEMTPCPSSGSTSLQLNPGASPGNTSAKKNPPKKNATMHGAETQHVIQLSPTNKKSESTAHTANCEEVCPFFMTDPVCVCVCVVGGPTG